MEKPIYVTRPSMPPYEEYVTEIASIWDACILTNAGYKHQQLENRLKKYLDVPEISLFCNGHMALEIAIRALELKGEIITTPYTFASTTHAITSCGLTPVFCDIDPVTWTLDPKKIESLITPQTSAIIPVHVYGVPCDVEAIDEIAKKYELKVIYDAAHAFGVEINGKSIGSFGDISMFSFHATKLYHTVEGGGLTYSDSLLKDRIERLRQFGLKGDDNATHIGTNAKMTEMHASMGLCNLNHVDEYILKRKKVFEHYLSRLNGISGLRFMHMYENVELTYAYFPIVVQQEQFGVTRDEMCRYLEENNVFPRKYFHPITSEFACYKGRFNPASTPVAKLISEQILVLPLYSELSMEEVDRICDLIIERRKK